IRSLQGLEVELDHLGRDAHGGLRPDQWVEILDDTYALRGVPGPLYQVESVDAMAMTVTLRSRAGAPPLPVYGEADRGVHPMLRAGDHSVETPQQGAGAIPVSAARDWYELEDGVQIRLEQSPAEPPPPGGEPAPRYRSGDYWLIPARTETGDVE